MMKKIILAIGLMFGGVAFVNAQQTQQQDTTSTQQSDQYRRDTTTDTQNQQDQTQQSDSTSTQQSDMYRTEGEGNVNDSTSNNTDANTTNDTDAASNQTTTGSQSTTTDDQSTTTQDQSTTESTTGNQSTTGTPTTDDQMSSQSQSGVSQDQEQEGEKIEVSELPAAVQTKLQGNDYQGWVVTSARKKMWSDPDNAQSESKEVYVIEAKNGSDTKKLKFDKDGNEIEHNKDKKDDQK